MVQMESEAEDEAEPDRTSPEGQQDRGKAGTMQGASKGESAIIARLKQKQVCWSRLQISPACIIPLQLTFWYLILDRSTKLTGCSCCICAGTTMTGVLSDSSPHDRHFYR